EEKGPVFEDRSAETAAELVQLEDRHLVSTLDGAVSIEVVVAGIVKAAAVEGVGSGLRNETHLTTGGTTRVCGISAGVDLELGHRLGGELQTQSRFEGCMEDSARVYAIEPEIV